MPIQTALDSISQNAGSPFGFKNRIINGGMVIDQRNAGASVTPTSGDYTLDRYRVYHTQASKFSLRQMEALDSGASNYESGSAPAGFKNSLRVTSASAYSITSTDYFTVRQRIEGLNCFDFNWGTSTPKSVTVSFWVKSSLTGTFGGCVMNSAGNRNYPFSYTISSSNTWEQKFVTITGDTTGTWLTTNGVGLQLIFSLGTGSNYLNTARTWTSSESYGVTGQTNLVATNAATWYMTGLQLEVGTQSTGFDYRDYGNELRMCQRYFELMDFSDVGNAGICNSSQWSGNNDQWGVIPYKVVKRTTPSATSVGTVILYGNAGTATTTPSLQYIGQNALVIRAQPASFGQNNAFIGNNSGFKLSVSAEL